MNLSRYLCLLFVVAALCGSRCPCLATEDVARVDFAHDVTKILKAHCVECHGGEEAKGGFSINSRELVLDAEAVSPGDAANSRMIELVCSRDPDDQMPPQDRPRLVAAEIEVLRAWVDQGLVWETGFTFAEQVYEPPLNPRRPDLPPVSEGRNNPIDRIIDRYLAGHDVPRPLPLGDAPFARRVYYDLIGLPPTPQQLNDFLSDSAADKHAALVSQLLDNREAYATHWLSFWNDLLRNAYSGTGYIDGGRRQITAWLYRSLYENSPYDHFVRELISPSDESAGFINGIQWRGDVNASQTREVQFAQNISQVFLGINMKCASCHDSFVDRWTLEETYSLASIYADEPMQLHRCDLPTGKMATAAWIFPELGQVDPNLPQSARLTQLASLMTHPQNGRLSRTIVNRLWHRLMGRGIVHPVDAMHTQPWSEDLLDQLAVELADRRYDLKQILELIANSAAYQSQAVVLEAEPAAKQYVYAGPIAKRLTAEQLLDSIWMITSAWPVPDEKAFNSGGRSQGGQLAAVLATLNPSVSLPASEVEINKLITAAPMLCRAALRPSDSLQSCLGRPTREQVVTSRPTQLNTLEAITLANGPRLAELLHEGALLLNSQPRSPQQLIQGVYLAALAREATPDEVQLARQLLGEQITQQNTEDLLWTVLMLPEFQILR